MKITIWKPQTHMKTKKTKILQEKKTTVTIAAWNIKCNNRELPDVEKETIKRQWDIVFISETGLISSKIGLLTTENQIFLQDFSQKSLKCDFIFGDLQLCCVLFN